ncbi:ROK family protein [Paenibacillus polymyxa]|uniref:ROK family protein n=1 Tax=Paenibacillus polymyxa TaxID=1406 RepID=UPI0002FB01D5|nr:ROK family protein [Paenibacillus polymyxa]NMP07874.1 ROK family protein [Paenibacillus polymyxa]
MATCGNILNELLQTGEVLEMELEESSGGRPARRYKYNADYSYIICLTVKTEGGVHSLTYAVANMLGDIIVENTSVVPHIDYEVIDDQIGELIHTYGNVKAVGIGIPGVVHQGVIDVCDLDLLIGVPVGPRLQDKYGLEVTIENDMHLTVYGFYNMQNYDEDKTFAIVTFPKDNFPGAGFIVDGHLLKGNTKFAGEVSFLPFGITREEQLKQLNSTQEFVPLAIKTITSIIAIIDPVSIALTGELSKPALLDDIYNGCLKDVPKEHMPEIFVKNDTHDEYMYGLISVTLESLTYNLQLVEKRK